MFELRTERKSSGNRARIAVMLVLRAYWRPRCACLRRVDMKASPCANRSRGEDADRLGLPVFPHETGHSARDVDALHFDHIGTLAEGFAVPSRKEGMRRTTWLESLLTGCPNCRLPTPPSSSLELRAASMELRALNIDDTLQNARIIADALQKLHPDADPARSSTAP